MRNKDRSDQKKRFSLFAVIWAMFIGLSTFIGAILLISAIAGALMASRFIKNEQMPSQMILTLRLDEGLIEQESTKDLISSLQDFGDTHITLQDIIGTLDKARTDPRVKALAVSLEGGDFGVANVQELRTAIKRFRASGKPAWVYSPSYAEAGGDMGAYYLASAFDQIWMQPVGAVALPGFDAEMPFFLSALQRLGVQPQFFQRKEYKSVMENLSRNDMSAPNKEMTTALLTDITGVLVTDIAADRKLAPAQVSAIIDQGIFTDAEALQAKLIDRVDHGDILIGTLRQSLGLKPTDQNLGMIELADYEASMDSELSKLKDKKTTKPKIGLISAVGEIVTGNGGGFGKTVVTPEEITQAFDDAIRDPDIKAIIFRIASPGGSPTASETIRRSVQMAVARNKPVIVSMGSMAGSGGYWIATDATRIFALPATLTGSIGVASGKMELSGAMQKLSINWDGVQIGKNADLDSFTKPFSLSGIERMNAVMDSIYNGFVDRVSKGRKMTPEAVEKIAKGRVWTGHQAVSLGLVDELGGLDSALDYTAKMIGLNDRNKMEVVALPKERTRLEEVLDLLNIKVMMSKIAGVTMTMIGQQVRAASVPHVMAYDPFLERKF